MAHYAPNHIVGLHLGLSTAVQWGAAPGRSGGRESEWVKL